MTLRSVLATRAPGSVSLIRLLVGAVFLLEGIKKFLFPADWGSGDSRGSASGIRR